jgi:hypothetical protein
MKVIFDDDPAIDLNVWMMTAIAIITLILGLLIGIMVTC